MSQWLCQGHQRKSTIGETYTKLSRVQKQKETVVSIPSVLLQWRLITFLNFSFGQSVVKKLKCVNFLIRSLKHTKNHPTTGMEQQLLTSQHGAISMHAGPMNKALTLLFWRWTSSDYRSPGQLQNVEYLEFGFCTRTKMLFLPCLCFPFGGTGDWTQGLVPYYANALLLSHILPFFSFSFETSSHKSTQAGPECVILLNNWASGLVLPDPDRLSPSKQLLTL